MDSFHERCSSTRRIAGPATGDRPQLRMPTSRDGRAVHGLAARCAPLEPDSLYCYLLRCTHYAETCVAAEHGDSLVGFVSAYTPPNRPDTLFVWQVAVAPDVRGQGLGRLMLHELLARPAGRRARRLETSIAPDNTPSWVLFRRLAEELGAELTRIPWFKGETHFGDGRADQVLARIGPLPGTPDDPRAAGRRPGRTSGGQRARSGQAGPESGAP